MASPKSKEEPFGGASSNAEEEENDPVTTEPLAKRQRKADDPLDYLQQELLDQLRLQPKLTALMESFLLAKANQTIQQLQQSGPKNEDHSVGIYPKLKVPCKIPLQVEQLEPEEGGIREIFERLVDSAKDEIRGSWEKSKAWYEEVHRAVSKFPILAQISSSSKGDYFCLLSSAYEIIDGFLNSLDYIATRNVRDKLDEPLDANTCFAKTIMLLIEINPYALLWKGTNNFTLAACFAQCELRAGHEMFVWAVTTKFGWIMDSKECSQEDIFGILLWYCAEEGHVNYSVMLKFFIHHPRFLRTPCGPSGMFPIHYIASSIVRENGIDETIEPLIEFMATKFPESLSARDSEGNTPLHYACKSMMQAMNTNDATGFIGFKNAVRACRILVERFPYALEYRDHQCQTPLELLDDIAYRKAGVQNVVLEMLRIFYPRRFSHDMLLVPLVRRASGVLEKEASMARTYLRVARVSMLLGKSARSPSRADDSEEVNEIYSEWSSKQLASMSTEMETTRSGNIASLRAEFA